MNIANRDTHGTSRLVNNDTVQVDICNPLKDVSNLDRRVYNQIQGLMGKRQAKERWGNARKVPWHYKRHMLKRGQSEYEAHNTVVRCWECPDAGNAEDMGDT